MQLKEFLRLGKHVNIDGSKIFVIDLDRNENVEKETIVILNGFPAISYDYHKVILELSEYYRVVIHDHFGFGFSELPDTYCFSLIEQADVCVKLWRELRLKEFTLMGHNYGTKVTQEILYRYNAKILPFKIRRVVLSQNSKKINYLNLININKLLKNTDLTRYREQLAEYHNKGLLDNLDFSEETSNVDSKKAKTIWNKFNDLQGQKEVLVLSNFLEETYLYWHRWLKALKDADIPVKIFWRKDDMSIKEVAITLASNQPKNVEFIENEKCFVIEDEPTEWLKMIMKRTNKNVYNALVLKYKVF